MRRSSLGILLLCALGGSAVAQTSPPSGVTILNPPDAIKPTGPWSIASRAGDYLFVAGMRGIDPKTNEQVKGDEARIRQAFTNMKAVAEGQGASLKDCVRVVVYVTDMFRFRPIANKVQEEMWKDMPFPPRTIVEVQRLNQDDILEVEGTFYAPKR